jgi:hypothetical protein
VAGEDDFRNVGVSHRVQQAEASPDVVVIVLGWFSDRLANEREGGEVHDRVDVLLGKHPG